MTALPPLTAYYSGYYDSATRRGGKPAGQVRRAHLVAPPEEFRRSVRETAFCGTYAHDTTHAPKAVIEAPYTLPEGIVWCPTCIGRAGEALGIIDLLVAAVLAAIEDAKAAGA